MNSRLELSAIDARRIALAAQGFASPRPTRPNKTHLRSVAKRLHAIQLDTVNILVRAHYLPFFSRLGPYPIEALDKLVNDAHELVELDAHQASIVPIALEPLLRWRALRSRRHTDAFEAYMESKRPGYITAIRNTVLTRGPLAAGELDDPGRGPKLAPADLPIRRKDGLPYAASSLAWGRDSDGRAVLDWLVGQGELVLAGRGPGFERRYDIAGRVLPESGPTSRDISEEDARPELVGLASRALGVATAAEIARYFGLKVGAARPAIATLVEEESLVPVRVEGWKDLAYLAAEAPSPKPVTSQALIGPFDSLTWERERIKRLFGFEYSFEIYVPAAKRKYGYYVLPFLLNESLVARVDLKSDRKAGELLVLGAFVEAKVREPTLVPSLARELVALAGWLGLEKISVHERGDLAKRLRAEIRRTS